MKYIEFPMQQIGSQNWYIVKMYYRKVYMMQEYRGDYYIWFDLRDSYKVPKDTFYQLVEENRGDK